MKPEMKKLPENPSRYYIELPNGLPWTDSQLKMQIFSFDEAKALINSDVDFSKPAGPLNTGLEFDTATLDHLMRYTQATINKHSFLDEKRFLHEIGIKYLPMTDIRDNRFTKSITQHKLDTGLTWTNCTLLVVQRFVNPKLYGYNNKTHRKVLADINGILKNEGYIFQINNSEPELREITAQDLVESTQHEIVECPPLSMIHDDPEMVRILGQRWHEAQICLQNDTCLAAIILMGSILEGSLYLKAISDPNETLNSSSAPTGENQKVKPIEKWSFENLLNVAINENWIKEGRKIVTKELQSWRNFIHPKIQKRESASIDPGSCEIAWSILKIAVQDLINSSSREITS